MQLEKIKFKGFYKEMVTYQSGPEFIVFFGRFCQGLNALLLSLAS